MSTASLLTTLGVASCLLYLATAGLLGLRLRVGAGEGAPPASVLAVLVALALTLHGVLLYHGVVTEQGLDLGFFNAASLVAWVVVLVLLLTTFARPLEALGVLVLPLAAAAVAFEITAARDPTRAVRSDLGVQLHVAVSILAYSVLTIGALQALALAAQEHELKGKRPGRLLQILPPLRTQETVLFQLIAAGFFLLSLSLVSGLMFVDDMFAQHLAHKTVLSLAAWAVFAVLLWGRWRHGWRGRRAVRFCLSGFVILALAYFGSKLVLELVLGRSWVPA